MNHFSVKQFLIDNNLVTKEGEFICSESQVNPAWTIGPYNQWETMIYLCTLVHFFNYNAMLDNLLITISHRDGNYYIKFDEKEERFQQTFDWGIVVDTIEFLIPHMAGSNVSYLAGMFFEL